MKIWFAACIPQNSVGGVKRSMVNLSEFLVNNHHQVKIICSSKWDRDNYLLFSIKLAIMFLFNICNQPDWIIARSTDSFFCALLIKLLHLKTKVALHNHGWEEKVLEVQKKFSTTPINDRTRWKSYYIRLPLLRTTLLLSDMCICGTLEEAKWINKKYKNALNKIKMVPNSVDIPQNPYWPQQDSFPPNFLMIGGFTWKKNLDYGIKLFKKILQTERNAKLYLIGIGKLPSEKKQELDELKDHVVIKETESLDGMVQWYQTCPFLLFPSRYEGGRAFTILESMAMGSVTMVFDIPSNRELITDQKNGVILDGTNINQDCLQIQSICSNQEKIKLIGLNAWKCAKRYSKKRQGERLEKLLLNKMKQ